MQKLRLLSAITTVFIFLLSGTGKADVRPFAEAAKLLPERIGAFKAIGQVRPFEDREDYFNGDSTGLRDYQTIKGQRLTVFVYKSLSDSGAYARFHTTASRFDTDCTVANLGASGCATPGVIFFYKGPAYVVISASGLPPKSEVVLDFARQFAETLDKGEGDIPPLVKHLPGWQSGNLRSLYAVSATGLKANVPNQPVFDAISFEGGVEAASASYGASRLVIIEFNTPQLATDNTARILAKIQELRSQGQAAPTVYRRVGNYAVFVFDAPTPEAANQLIDQVRYQQVVQWLGENPFSLEKATREFTETTLGVFVSVVKASGLALVTCLAVGGCSVRCCLERDERSSIREAYADSDAMLRLNLDELTWNPIPPTAPA